LKAAHELAHRLMKGAPLAQRAMKEMAMRAPHLTSSEAIRIGEAMRIVANSSADSHEGLTAVAERRQPRWQGR
jgi:enoyl-CoA hydratase/carnithine racemase